MQCNSSSKQIVASQQRKGGGAARDNFLATATVAATATQQPQSQTDCEANGDCSNKIIANNKCRGNSMTFAVFKWNLASKLGPKPQLPHNLNMQYVANQGGRGWGGHKRLPNVECVSAVAKTHKTNKTRQELQRESRRSTFTAWFGLANWLLWLAMVQQWQHRLQCTFVQFWAVSQWVWAVCGPLWRALHLSISVCCLLFALGIFVLRDVPSNWGTIHTNLSLSLPLTCAGT